MDQRVATVRWDRDRHRVRSWWVLGGINSTYHKAIDESLFVHRGH
jgi:hypothetical protein